MDQNTNHSQANDIIIEEAQTVKVTPRSADTPAFSTPVAIVIGFAIVAAAFYFGPGNLGAGNDARNAPSIPAGNSAGTNDSGDGDAAPIPDIGLKDGDVVENITPGDTPVLGNSRAPVLLVVWGDYQCPFTRQFLQNIKPALRDQYVKSGKVRFAYRDFAFIGEETTDAAMATRCANEQGKFWEYQEKLEEAWDGENKGAFARENLKKFARELGLNGAKFDTCFDSGKYKDAVTKDLEAGRTAGVNGTPTTFINGVMLTSGGQSVGAAPYEVFKAAIDAELAKKK